MDGDGVGGEVAGEKRQGQHPEHPGSGRGAERQPGHRGPGARGRRVASAARRTPEHERVDRNRRRREDQGEGGQRAAPPEPADEPGLERHEDSARQPRHERHHEQRAVPALHGEPADDRRERRLVECRRHGESHEGPDRVERAEALDPRPHEEERRRQARAERHDAAGAVPVDPASDGQRRQRRGQEPDRQGAGELDPREAEVGFHRSEHDRETIIEDAPRHRLGDRETGHDEPAVVDARGVGQIGLVGVPGSAPVRRRGSQDHAGADGVRDERVPGVEDVALDEPERAPGILDSGARRDAARAYRPKEVDLHLDGRVAFADERLARRERGEPHSQQRGRGRRWNLAAEQRLHPVQHLRHRLLLRRARRIAGSGRVTLCARARSRHPVCDDRARDRPLPAPRRTPARRALRRARSLTASRNWPGPGGGGDTISPMNQRGFGYIEIVIVLAVGAAARYLPMPYLTTTANTGGRAQEDPPLGRRPLAPALEFSRRRSGHDGGRNQRGACVTLIGMTDGPREKPGNFIRDIIVEHNASGRFGGNVITRFPPEPNGYLHIGHAQAISIDFGMAQEFGGRCHLRFDDTNPIKESQEYVDSIIDTVRWLGYDWGKHLHYASDYFEQLYEWAVQLIEGGKAYVDDLTPEQMSEYRGTLTEPGRESPYRNRSVAENLDLFRRMRAGEFEEGTKTLRAKIDMASGNINLRDPVMYRIRKATHHRTGDAWCIYPMYDWAHGQSDSIEGVTHSICTLEYEDHRPLYDWYLDQLGVHHPQQIEFARLNLSHTIMSKRKLLELVQQQLVTGWDDPRMPTLP